METADVVIVGGGIVGSSIAWHLTEAGCTSVLVLEREAHQGKGSTGKSMGGVRAQFSTPVNIRMSLYSIPFYAAFAQRLGHPADYRAQGYLFLATSAAHLDYLRANQEQQRSLGLRDACMLATAEVARAFPQLRTDDVRGAAFCPSDGFVDPYSAMVGFITAACDRGVHVWKKAEVTAISRNGHARFTVQTTRGPISTAVVVNAAGPWAASIAAMVGFDLPVRPLRRMLVPTEPFDRFPHTAPMIIDMSNGFHFRPEALGFLLAWNDPDEPPSDQPDFDPDFVEKILQKAAARVPIFEELPVNPKRGWAGLYEMTPDHHCILGPVESVSGFFCANGFSGHGVMHAPATGKVLADLITRGDTELIDWRVVRPGRFAAGEQIHETAIL